MGMIAGSRHAEAPEVLAKDELSELAPQLPPMLPKMPPIVWVDGRCPVDCPVLQKTRDAEEQTFSRRSMVTKQLEFCPLGQDQERNLV